MDELADRRYDKAADDYISVLLKDGVFAASCVRLGMVRHLDKDELDGRIRTKLERMGYRLKEIRHNEQGW